MTGKILVTAGMTVVTLFLFACGALKNESFLPFQHPLVFENMVPICTDCHEDRTEKVNFKFYNHTSFFAKNHRLEAYQGMHVCSICHQQKHCNDCHGVGIELKPSLKNPIKTFRKTMHRGDYISRHRIDGRIDPTSCFRCHGNPKTAKTCVKCHG